MKFPIPDSALAQHIAVLGKTGSGKTSTSKLIVEHVVAEGARVCILDPIKSDWWGLISSADGKRAGLPFHILGGPRGHVPLHERAGKAIAEIVASGALPLSIIDMADFGPGGQTRFFTEFAQTLLKRNKGVLYLVMEEAHMFAPKERSGLEGENFSVHYSKLIATAGRTKGLRLIACTQRTQALHNAVLGSCDTMIAHRFTAPADADPVVKWFKGNATKEATETVQRSLSSLNNGEAWVFSGEAQIFDRIQFPRIKTYDNTKTPTGNEHVVDVRTASIDQDKLRAIIGHAVEEAEANDPKKLRERIAELERQLEKGEASQEDIEAARRDGIDKGYAAASAAIAGKVSAVIRAGDEFMAQLRSVSAAIEDSAKQHKTAVPRELPREFRAKDSGPVKTPISTGAKFPTPSHRGNGAGESLPIGEAKTLTALIQYPNGLRREQLTVLTGYKRSARDTYIQRLKARGYLTVQGDTVIATDAGCAALPNAEPLPTGRDLQAYWLERLPQGERRILEFLIECWPADIERNNLDETGYKRSARDTYLQRLRAKQLVVETGRGLVKASDDLFGK